MADPLFSRVSGSDLLPFHHACLAELSVHVYKEFECIATLRVSRGIEIIDVYGIFCRICPKFLIGLGPHLLGVHGSRDPCCVNSSRK